MLKENTYFDWMWKPEKHHAYGEIPYFIGPTAGIHHMLRSMFALAMISRITTALH
jgi:hypothetical protein